MNSQGMTVTFDKQEPKFVVSGFEAQYDQTQKLVNNIIEKSLNMISIKNLKEEQYFFSLGKLGYDKLAREYDVSIIEKTVVD